MAVENKFKLNVIAASVLMGLSLSAMAETGPSSATTPPAETAPAKVTSDTGFNPVVVAQASAPADATKLQYHNTSTVSSLFADKTGAVANYESAVNKAFGGEGVLDANALKVIADFNNTQEKDKQTTADWKSFKNRAAVIQSEYESALKGLYGNTLGAYNTDLSTGTLDGKSPVSAESDKGAFGAYVNGIAKLQSTLNDFNTALIGPQNNGVASGVTEGSFTQNATLKADAQKVVAYRAYLLTWAKGQAAELKKQDATNQIMATLPQLQHFVAEWGDYSGNGSTNNGPDLTAKYSHFMNTVITLITTGKGDADGLNKARGDVKTAADNLKTAINASKILQDGTPNDNPQKADFDNLIATVKNAVDTMGDTDTDRKNWSSLEGNGTLGGLPSSVTYPFGDGNADILNGVKAIKVTSVQDAIKGLQDAYKELCAKGGAASVCNNAGSKGADLKAAWETLTGKDHKGTDTTSLLFQYKTAQAKLDNLKDNLKTIQAELKTKIQTYTAARKAYFTASDAYNATKFDDARTAYENLGKAVNAEGTGLIAVRGQLQEAINNAAKQYASDRNNNVADATALSTSLSKLKTLIPVKLQVDSLILDYQQKAGQKTDASGMSELAQLQAAYQSASDAKNKASDVYNKAVTGYKDAVKAYQTAAQPGSGGDTSKAKTALSIAAKNLLLAAGYDETKHNKLNDLTFTGPDGGQLIAEVQKLYSKESGVKPGTFVDYTDITNVDFKPSALTDYNTAKDNLSKNGKVVVSRQNVARGLMNLADLRVLYTDSDWANLKIGTDDKGEGGKSLSDIYLTALEGVGEKTTSAEEQKKVANAESVTHYLGWTNVGSYDFTAGRYNPVILETGKDGNVTGIKRDFSAADLYTGTQDKPFTTTVLNIEAPVMSGDNPTAANTITVGEAGTKDKKATPVDVWARTSATTGAVNLDGNLKTAIAVAGKDGAPEVIRGADRIVLQNMNIHNSLLADKVNTLAKDMTNIGLRIDTHTVDSLLNKDIGQALANLAGTEGTFGTADVKSAPDAANILLDNLNITLQNDSVGGISTAIDLSGTGNHILANGGVFDAGKTDNPAKANALDITGANNLVDFEGSTLKGNIYSTAAGNTVYLTNGSLTGNAGSGDGQLTLALNGSTWTGASGKHSPDVSLSNNSVWNVKAFADADKGKNAPDGVTDPYSSVRALSLYGSNSINLVSSDGQAQLGGHGFAGAKSAVTLKVDGDLYSDGKGVTSVLAGTYSPDNIHSLTNAGLAGGYQFGSLKADGLAVGGQYRLSVESAGAEPYTIGGRLADGAGETSAHAFVSYKTSENRVVTGQDGKPVSQNVKSDADFTSLSVPAELGVYQYAAEKVMDAANNRTNIYYSSTGQLSNSAATVVSLAAAPVDVANLESDTLAKHMNSVRHGKDSGVWVSYFGGENRNTTASGPEYKLNTSGVMLGADTLTENNWLAGVAVSSARSDMSVMNSSGDLNSYGAQFYMSRRYDSGVFVDSALQFNHFSNTAKARMTDGQQAKADFSGNSYGLEAKVGYAWNSEGFFAEPYVRAAARAFDGEHYALSNGMTVNSNDYKSMLGEVGADLGYQYAISGGYVKPYLHLAALNEFADGNSVRVNNVSLDDSVKGAAFQAGLGAEVKVTDNLGGYAAFDYTKGDNTERPWQATVGVNYTW
ncbi:autotransporter outer membrane beta-barrel domain-containing protein [Salmonella enterica]|nr:autotransporter outer membrane beta-barrel domain-containing protein [Salmonella enterica]